MKDTETPEPFVVAAMLMRLPAEQVFAAFCDPGTMSKIWFTHSCGPIEEGKTLTWKWEQYGAEGKVQIKMVRKNELVSFIWDVEGTDVLVTLTFEKTEENYTFLSVSETGFTASGTELLRQIADQTGGWTLVLSALKAYLEHGIILTVVTDRHPQAWAQKQP